MTDDRDEDQSTLAATEGVRGPRPAPDDGRGGDGGRGRDEVDGDVVGHLDGDAGDSPDATADVLDEIGDSLLGLGEMLLDDTDMDAAVTNVLQVGLATLGPDPAVSLTISKPGDARGRFVTRDATDDWARQLDEWQYEHGEGPCLHADETGRTCVVDDCGTDERFPRFREVAAELGVRSAVSYPMIVRGRSLGSINVFYREADCVTPRLVEAGERLARTAAPLLANWLAHMRVSTLVEQLEEALEGRGTIERAKGLLMGELGVDEDRAFEVLRTQSQHENIKLRVVAAQLLEQRRHIGPR